ncbi:unnamed protein product [Rhizoctonia solani]|uniref:Uncharacterized protein n=1 Tax=Rhizoctonia solani TaxID=456999 RepID=A0A8H3C7I5_9AGAM|nr:unnamed protein product [Rhizoctonia solani]
MASPAPTERAALKVFGIPELAHLICALVQKRDYANLMQVCREPFYSTLPFVWEEVDRPDMLVSMIPGGGIVSYESEMAPYMVMQLPGSLDLSRFNIYAPHVKRLTLSVIDVDGYDDWDRFLDCTRSVDLLPNLETIYFPTQISEPGSGKVEIDSMNWAIAFLSTSLHNLVQAPLKAARPIRDTPLLCHSYSYPYEEPSKNLSDIIPLLATHSSRITTLTVHEHGSKQLSPELLNAWRRLPLVNLQLGWTVIYGCGFDDFCSILLCLPLLESLLLNMTQEPFELKQMRKIVELLPRLRRIQIPVKWESITQLTRADFTPCQSQSASLLYAKSNFYLPESQEKGASQLARYLSILRPTALVVCESFQALFYRPFGYIDEEPKNIINAELSRLSLE